MPNTGDLILKIQQLFFTKLEKQTNWGKEQVKRLYLECQNEVLRNAISNQSEVQKIDLLSSKTTMEVIVPKPEVRPFDRPLPDTVATSDTDLPW